MKFKILNLLVIALFAALHPVLGQDVVDLESYQSRYPEKAAIYLEYSREISIDLDRDSIIIYADQTERILHLNSNSKSLAKDKVFSSFFVQTKSITAQTLVPDVNDFKIMKVEDFVEKDESSSGVFYDDSKSTSFIFPGVKPGSITQLHYRQQILDPRFLNAFYFQSFLPIEKSELVLKVHKDISIDLKMFHQNDLPIDYSQSQKGKYIIHRWVSENVDEIKYERNSPSISYFTPHLVHYISKVKRGNSEDIILGEVKDLFKWYANFTSHLNVPVSPEIQETVNDLTKGLDSEEEKVRSIYYWVQDNIKYIAFEEGMRGFIPHNADYIYSNRYGDCKDMACIMRGMLKAAGIESHFTWIGSRDIPYTYEEVPTPIVDNHMITTYYRNREAKFLDATSKYTQYGLPSTMIQGKQALVQTGPESFRLEKVPIINKEVNFRRDSAFIQLRDAVVYGEGVVKAGGYEKVFDTYRISFASGNKLDEFIKAKVSRGSNKFLLDHYELENVSDKDLPLVIKFNFNIQDYYKQIGDEIYVNLNLKKPLFNQFIDDDKRNYPIEAEFKFQHNYTTVLEIPDGYQLDYVPDNIEFENEIAGFSVHYSTEGNRVILKNSVYKDYLMLRPEDFSKWNDVISKLNEAYSDALILKKI